MLPDSQKSEIGSSKYETSPSAGKNNVEHGSVSLQCGGNVRGHRLSFVTTDELFMKITKITLRICV